MTRYRLAFTSRTGMTLVSERIYDNIDEADDALVLCLEGRRKEVLVGADQQKYYPIDIDLTAEAGMISAE